MFARKWWLVYGCFALGAIGIGVTAYIAHVYGTPSKAFGDAPPPVTPAGALQMLLAVLMGVGFTGSGFIMTLINWYKSIHGSTPVVPANEGTGTASTIPAVLPDLEAAFADWIVDRSSAAKSRRFWFDLCELGIECDPDPDTRKWLQDGSEILRKKFFPAIATKA